MQNDIRERWGWEYGFTLVEILIVVLIIGLLAALAIPSFMQARTTAQKNACLENQHVAFSAANMYDLELGSEIQGGVNGVTLRNLLIEAGYVTRRNYFECPSSQKKDYDDYALIYQDQEMFGIRCLRMGAEHALAN